MVDGPGGPGAGDPGAGDLQHIGELLGAKRAGQSQPDARIAAAWPDAVGPEISRNTQPQSLWKGRLVVATSSAVWAQTLQFMGGEIVSRLNRILGEEMVVEIRPRPAGWDPGGAAGAPAALGGGDPNGGAWAPESASAGPETGRSIHPLTAEEEDEVDRIRQSAPDDELGERIAAAMRACLQRRRPESG